MPRIKKQVISYPLHVDSVPHTVPGQSSASIPCCQDNQARRARSLLSLIRHTPTWSRAVLPYFSATVLP